ncbi:MAG: Tm-1-like ATP-binding domain-containing protein [Dehalococcoidia bacterium]|nr:Tm-1-like ATP-binding domain-containing protein [Dehalococcoidia bacterium]
MEQKVIVLVGTFDTKGQEYLYVKELITKAGYAVVTIDVGTGARGKLVFTADYSREEVVKVAKSSMPEVIALGNEGKEVEIMEIMASGAAKICQQLYQSGKLDGIISLGGHMGTDIATSIMRSLPFGVPKVMLSTVASGNTRPFVGTRDIVMMPSVADIVGLNRITETVLAQAAGAIMGMVSIEKPSREERPLVGMTVLGGTMVCALRVKKELEERGYEVVVFHGNGIGGKTMEEFIKQGVITSVFDLVPDEVVGHMYQAWNDAGPTRLETAGLKGIPQLIAPGHLNQIIYDSADKIPERFRKHYVHRHGPSIYTLRAQKKEMVEIGEVVATKLNKAVGPTAVIVPLKGLTIIDPIDKGFVDREADSALFETLKRNLKPEIEVTEVDAHINDEVFAKEATKMFLSLTSYSGSGCF